ncbi:LytR/AlgR family response regulator transcription factor [Desulforamulus aeronauticus]|uniref:Stage 0 sporulation protein A homolog n=1 Tax=Desulforamulus aeronauticus DSM 10349 TaxID=1121421 RepID=A0A1M6VTA6_9FIRM|nr:LytTR family DNA-binding domain-containing protein [Desulforamulus aeronauticus]SHK84762.1 two component transcriptional regulator, LytTR family [Desulforamulus aeronauticus DSM 10349]
MVTIFLCDDNSETVEKYSTLIKRTAEKHQIDIALSVFYSGESLVFHMSDTPDLPDIIYLDILMGKLNGINTAKQLRKLGCNAEIIFLTSSEDYVFDSFDVFPIHYLLKEETAQEKFEQVFLRAVHLSAGEEAKKFVCKSGASHKIISLKEISHYDINRGVVTVHYGKNEKFEYWMTLAELEDQLRGKDFIRTHRSYIVNLQYIAKFARRSVVLKTGESIPVGVTYEDKVKTAFMDYIVRINAEF